jgi:hypothetical protein
MKRTTIYLDAELEARLKLESLRRQQPMADLIREAVREKLDASQRVGSRYAGSFSSGRQDVADRAEDLLTEGGFGRD